MNDPSDRSSPVGPASGGFGQDLWGRWRMARGDIRFGTGSPGRTKGPRLGSVGQDVPSEMMNRTDPRGHEQEG